MLRRIGMIGLLLAVALSGCSSGSLEGQSGKSTTQTEQWVETLPGENPPRPPAIAVGGQETGTQAGETTTAEPTFTPLTPAGEQWVEALLNEMTLQQKVGQLIVTGLVEQAITPEMCLHLETYMPGGVILQTENIRDPQQVRELVQSIKECVARTQTVPLLITLAHEGEYVNRFGNNATLFPAALAQGATGDPQVAYQIAEITGSELVYSGFNMVLGPVADVLLNPDNRVISVRAFGGDTQQVSQFVAEAVAGYNAAGLIPVLKHYPGHGGVADDSHETLPRDDASQAELDALYLPPFQSGIAAGAPVIMTSHIAFPQITGDDTPTTLSQKLLDDLRQRLNFQGVIISDAMRMKAVNGKELSLKRASLQALVAGVDLLLLNFPGHAGIVHAELVDAVLEGRLSEARLDEAVRRVLTLKAERGLMAYPGDAPEPDWRDNQAKVDEIARRTITVLRDTGGNIPLPAQDQRYLVIAPQSDWGVDEQLVSALQENGAQVALEHYPGPWSEPPAGDERLAEIAAAAQGVDRVVIFTWQAHILRVDEDDDWQTRLVDGLLAIGKPLVVVAIKSPTDVLEFPAAPTVLAMFGTTPAQKQAVLEVLLGERVAEGKNPLPELEK